MSVVLKLKLVHFDSFLGVHKQYEVIDSPNPFLKGRFIQCSHVGKKTYIYWAQKKKPAPEDVYPSMQEFLASFGHDTIEIAD